MHCDENVLQRPDSNLDMTDTFLSDLKITFLTCRYQLMLVDGGHSRASTQTHVLQILPAILHS